MIEAPVQATNKHTTVSNPVNQAGFLFFDTPEKSCWLETWC